MAVKRGAPKYESPVLDQLGHFNPEWFRFLVTGPESDSKAITSGTNTTIPHRLKSPPRQLWAVLICTSTELGYAAGDEVAPAGFEDASDYGVSLSADVTNIYATVGANGIRLMRRTAPIGEFATIDNSKWRLVVRFEP
jgi:hypothetical protein